MLRWLRQHPLLVRPHLRLQAKRTPTRKKPRPTSPHEWWAIGMTQVMLEGFGGVYLVLVLDWDTKTMVGYDTGMPCTAKPWLAALDMAVNRQFPHGARGQGVSLLRDHGCQPTSRAFMGACATLDIHQVCTSDHNPQGHAATERCMRPLKEACRWLHEWTGPLALVKALAAWMDSDNEHYLHATRGDKTPRQCERAYSACHRTPFAAA
jgi:putative transposase